MCALVVVYRWFGQAVSLQASICQSAGSWDELVKQHRTAIAPSVWESHACMLDKLQVKQLFWFGLSVDWMVRWHTTWRIVTRLTRLPLALLPGRYAARRRVPGGLRFGVCLACAGR